MKQSPDSAENRYTFKAYLKLNAALLFKIEFY